MPPWVTVGLFLLAVARATRLLTTDYITAPIRAWAGRRRAANLAYLLSCPWCLSVWVSAVGAAATLAWPDRWWVQVPLLGLAGSYVTGVLEQAMGLLGAAHDKIEGVGRDGRPPPD